MQHNLRDQNFIFTEVTIKLHLTLYKCHLYKVKCSLMYKRALKTTEEILHATKHNLQDGILSQGDVHEYTYIC